MTTSTTTSPTESVRPAAGRGNPDGRGRRPCPMCGEMIVATAAKCRFCGEVFDPTLKKAKSKKKKKYDAGTTKT